MKRAVVLLSGGVDSVTTLAVAKAEGFEMYALSFDYGQRHRVELECARKNGHKFSVKNHRIIACDLRGIGGSALTSDSEVPKDRTLNAAPGMQNAEGRMHHDEFRSGTKQTDIPVTYVPARNSIFLSFALAWAETLEAANIFIGANAVDYSGYPDCRPEYIKAFQDMANLATKASVEGRITFTIRAPLIQLSKAEIVKKGTELAVDYSLTWSCYDPVLKKGRYRPCLHCDSCLLRAKGFKEAGLKDPLLHK